MYNHLERDKIVASNLTELETKIVDTFLANTFIFSYIVFYKDNNFVISYSISEVEHYNTIDVDNIFVKISNSNLNTKTNLICFEQPSIDILIECYDLLILKLAKEQERRWNNLEFEDLYQECRLILCRLYSKGYYIHKRLLQKSFENEVLQIVRKNMYKPLIVSLDYEIEHEDDNVLTVADMIPDNDTVEEIQSKIDKEAEDQLYKEVESEIIDMIGKRKWDQLVRDYKYHHTTNASQQLMKRIRDKFKEEGLSLQKYIQKYGG